MVSEFLRLKLKLPQFFTNFLAVMALMEVKIGVEGRQLRWNEMMTLLLLPIKLKNIFRHNWQDVENFCWYNGDFLKIWSEKLSSCLKIHKNQTNHFFSDFFHIINPAHKTKTRQILFAAHITLTSVRFSINHFNFASVLQKFQSAQKSLSLIMNKFSSKRVVN